MGTRATIVTPKVAAALRRYDGRAHSATINWPDAAIFSLGPYTCDFGTG